MIAMLTGNLAYRSPEQIIIDVSGVGYRLQIPLSTFYALPETGQITLHVHTHVKEDAFQLFGFPLLRKRFLLTPHFSLRCRPETGHYDLVPQSG